MKLPWLGKQNVVLLMLKGKAGIQGFFFSVSLIHAFDPLSFFLCIFFYIHYNHTFINHKLL